MRTSTRKSHPFGRGSSLSNSTRGLEVEAQILECSNAIFKLSAAAVVEHSGRTTINFSGFAFRSIMCPAFLWQKKNKPESPGHCYFEIVWIFVLCTSNAWKSAAKEWPCRTWHQRMVVSFVIRIPCRSFQSWKLLKSAIHELNANTVCGSPQPTHAAGNVLRYFIAFAVLFFFLILDSILINLQRSSLCWHKYMGKEGANSVWGEARTRKRKRDGGRKEVVGTWERG